MKLLKFYVPNCVSCPEMKRVGPFGFETRYCFGFPGKKQKRLPKRGLQRSVASWCPKQILPPACRILGFVDEKNAMMEFLLNGDTCGKENLFSPSPQRYKIRGEYPLAMSAKQFYEALESSSLLSIFPDIDFRFGEILEIDDGHKPYYFYYAGDSGFILLPWFDKSKICDEISIRQNKNQR